MKDQIVRGAWDAATLGRVNGITERVLGAAIDVHRTLGPGLLESAYEECLVLELVARGLRIERQKPLPITYRDHVLPTGYRLDVVVEDDVLLELKAVDRIVPLHEAQLLTYLRLSGCVVGLLINFNVRMLRNGIRRRIAPTPAGATDAPPEPTRSTHDWP